VRGYWWRGDRLQRTAALKHIGSSMSLLLWRYEGNWIIFRKCAHTHTHTHLIITSAELTGCYYKMECRGTCKTLLVMWEMNVLLLSESAGMRIRGNVHTAALPTSRLLSYTWNLPLAECFLETASSSQQQHFSLFIFQVLKPETW